VIVRPLVAWIWIGGLMFLFGAFVAIAPSIQELLASVKSPFPRVSVARPAMASWFVLVLVAALLLLGGSVALAQDSSSLMAGTVAMNSPEEKQLFDRVLCQCGGCARLPLSGCICHWAEEKRAVLREQLAAGKSVSAIQADYAEEHGAKAIAIPRDKGLDRALWAVPVAAFVLAAGGLTMLGRKWVKRSKQSSEATAGPELSDGGVLDRELDEELKRLDTP